MRLRVMTFNVGNGLAPAARLVAVLRAVDADVVGLQEVTAPQAEALRAELARLYPYQVFTAASGFVGKALLSRYPLLDPEELTLYPARPDLQASVEVDDGPRLKVLVGHPPPPRLRVRQRGVMFDPLALAQIDALGGLALASPPAILLGDFNMTPRNPTYARLAAAGLLDAFAEAGLGRGWTLPVRVGHSARWEHHLHGLPLRPVARVDYVWSTPLVRAEAAWVGPDAGSDHLPVVAGLVLPST